MSFFRSWTLRLALLALVVAPVSPTRPAAAATADQPAMVSALPPEVRIRKLHLVRPDLIPYPIAMEVYC